ncbi:MAG: GNAT family N-acetyltransferase [Pseudomonadota bacterium]
MQVEVISDKSNWLDVRVKWNDLLRKNEKYFNPFLSFEWLYSWWEIFGENKELLIITVNNGGALVGIAPLMVSSKTGFNICEFIGTGRSDYLGFIVDRELRHAVFSIFFEYLKNRVSLHLINLRDYYFEPLEIIEAANAVGLKAEAIIGDVAPRVIMPGAWEEYLNTKSRKSRANRKRELRQVESDSEITISCEKTYKAELISELAQVEARSWKSERGNPRFRGKGRAFFSAFFERFAELGWLEVWVLRYRGEALAHSVNFCCDDVTYVYNLAHCQDSEKFVKHRSLGSTLTAFALRESFHHHRQIYDFLRGDEPYKKLWASDAVNLAYIQIWQPRILSMLASLVHFRIRFWLRKTGFGPRIIKILRGLTP